MDRPLGQWLIHKAGRLWRRLLTGDFIRTRPKQTTPSTGSSLPAYAIAYNEHGGYCVPLETIHRPASRFIMAGRVWERETLSFLAENIGDGDIVHAGTSFGDFLPLLSKIIAPTAHVWAYEPNAVNYKSAQLTIAINELENVTLTNAGLGASPAKANLIIENNRGLALGGASYVSAKSGATEKSEEIRLVALDDAIPDGRHIEILQLDVEGYEEQALTGALKIIERDQPLLILETPPSDEWFSKHLKPLNYIKHQQIDENTVYKTAADQ